MSLLSAVQEFCRRTGLTVPVAVTTSNDTQVLQYLGLANEVAEYLVQQFTWQDLVLQTTFTTVSGQDQGAITTLAPQGFLSIINETIFDRTQRIQIFGPLNAHQWQYRQALPASGPIYQYRIRGNHLLFNPNVPVGHTCAFEYKSSWIVANASGVPYSATFQADDDQLALPEKLLILGLRWTWKKEKGLDYGEELSNFDKTCASLSAADGGKKILHMDQSPNEFQPAIVIPLGNWNT